MDVFVTGSNAKFLSKDIVTEFAGRGDEVHMYPLSFTEFMSVYKGDKYMGLSECLLLEKIFPLGKRPCHQISLYYNVSLSGQTSIPLDGIHHFISRQL